MEIIVNGETIGANQKAPRLKLRDYIPTVEKGLLDQSGREKRFFDFLRAAPSKNWFLKLRSLSGSFSLGRPSQSQNPIMAISSDASPSDPTASTNNHGRGFRVPFVRRINWKYLLTYCKKWVKHPMNICFLIWLFFVAACLFVLFLLMTGLLNHTIQKSSVRKNWTEIINQVLNALFTIMCLYQHPRISHHLVLICRYRSEDILELRNIYCKNGTSKPNERGHMMFVVILLQITCFSQYGLCALYWAFTNQTRPDWAQILFIALGTGAPIIAGLYAIFSPLGRKKESDSDDELRGNEEAVMGENELKLYNKRVIVSSPEWVGGIFDCWDDSTVYCLSLFCTFCVFGWNMERLGFGNMYVHIITFILLCSAPVIVFSIAALNINNDAIRYVVGVTGIILCLFGLLYGGFWRIQIRKRFKLPGNGFCLGFFNVSDFIHWLFCWSCSLAQEVRTANFYDVESDGFSRKGGEEGSERGLTPLPRENGSGPVVMLSLDAAAANEGVVVEMTDARKGEVDEVVRSEMLRSPVQNLMQEEEEEEAPGAGLV